MRHFFSILIFALLSFSAQAEICTITLSGDWTNSSLRIKEPTTGIDTVITATSDVWFRGTGNATFIYFGASGTNTFSYNNCGGLSFTSPFLNDSDVFISNSPLPVELTYFKYDDGFLKWETSSEVNNYGFEIEQSENGYDFYTIGFVEGAGTTLETQTYTYPVETKTVAYYRLKQLDYDGQYEYSDIVVVNGLEVGFSLTTNVVRSELFINGTGEAFIINNFGQVERQLQLNEFKIIDISNLSNGLYYIRNNNKTIRFLKIE